MKIAYAGGSVAKGARDLYEKETKRQAISSKNSLNYQYIDEEKLLDSKKNTIFTKNKKKCFAKLKIFVIILLGNKRRDFKWQKKLEIDKIKL